MNEIGPKFGDYPAPRKFQLVVKPHTTKYVEDVYFEAKIKVASADEKYLRGTIRISYFENIYFKENLNQWISELELLSKITTLEPRAAYCAFGAGLKHQIKVVSKHQDKFLIPAFTNGFFVNRISRRLLYF